ncbi:MAG: hypothetical protein KUL75_06485 [Sterolibacterium sp.]|nr:hypothetical protein [Sterolibacterium sp.]
MYKLIAALLLGGSFWLTHVPLANAAAPTDSEASLVTLISGKVQLQAAERPPEALKAFVKLRPGDQLALSENARLQIVYFDGGRQETWQGTGQLKIGAQASTPSAGNLQPAIRMLPKILVKQMAKTPGTDGHVKAGMVRMRSIPSGGTLESVEKHYAELKAQAEEDDRNPEIYLLSGYFELHEYDKLDALLRDLNEKSPDNQEVKVLASLYKRAINNARMAKNQ